MDPVGDPAPTWAHVAGEVRPSVPGLAEEVVRRITESDEHWARALDTPAELVDPVADVFRRDLDLLTGTDPSADGGAAVARTLTALGAYWARRHVPLASLLDADRIGVQVMWTAVARAARRHGAGADDLVALAARFFDVQAEGSASIRSGWASESAAMVVGRASEREALAEALLAGLPLRSLSLWEVAEHLGLPRDTSYAVAVADTREVARAALDDVERRLRAAGFASAWRLAPDSQTGIVALRNGHRDLTALLVVLRAIAPCPVGVSTVFDDLDDTARARELARIALLAASSDSRFGRVLAFDEHPVAVTAVASPDVNRRIAHDVLGPVLALDADQRTLLLDTLWAWIDTDGSAVRAGERLYLHRNTVHQRLTKLEGLTGRSLRSPRDVTELCVAVSTLRSLPATAGLWSDAN